MRDNVHHCHLQHYTYRHVFYFFFYIFVCILFLLLLLLGIEWSPMRVKIVVYPLMQEPSVISGMRWGVSKYSLNNLYKHHHLNNILLYISAFNFQETQMLSWVQVVVKRTQRSREKNQHYFERPRYQKVWKIICHHSEHKKSSSDP